MTKRKVDIFTVVEAVPNWFVASCEIRSLHEETDEAITHGSGTSPDILSPTPEALPPTAEIVTNWVEPGLYTWTPAKGSKSAVRCDKANWAEPNWAEPNSATWAVASRSEDTTNWTENIQGRQEPADVARAGIIKVTHDSDSSAEGGITKMEGLGHNAFWSLLKDAGYEEW